MPLVFVQGALVAGAGTLVVIALARGAPFDPALIGGVIALLPFAALVWLGYVTSADGAFAEATKALRERPGFVIFGGGYVAPLVLFGLALAVGGERTLAILGGLLLVTTQAYAKAMLILRCGRLRPITVPHLRLHRRPSEISGSKTPSFETDRRDAAPSAGFARAIRIWGKAARSEAHASDERRKGGEAPLRGGSSS